MKPKSRKVLDEMMDKKWAKLHARKLPYGLIWLNAMHDLLDWYEEQRNMTVHCHKCGPDEDV